VEQRGDLIRQTFQPAKHSRVPLKMIPKMIMLLLLAIGGCARPSSTISPKAKNERALAPEAPVVDIGVLRSGGSASKIFKLKNQTDRACNVATLETSCPCTSLRLQETTVAPSGETYIRIDTDMVKEPEFLGNLSIDARGFDQSGVEVMRFQIIVLVVQPKRIDQLTPK